MATLPDDVLAAVLGLLPARSLVVSRCVRQAWRGHVDERYLLLPHLLPHAVRAIFINYVDHSRPHFFASPTPAGRRIDGERVEREEELWLGEGAHVMRRPRRGDLGAVGRRDARCLRVRQRAKRG